MSRPLYTIYKLWLTTFLMVIKSFTDTVLQQDAFFVFLAAGHPDNNPVINDLFLFTIAGY